jgi:hypothetical protein
MSDFGLITVTDFKSLFKNLILGSFKSLNLKPLISSISVTSKQTHQLIVATTISTGRLFSSAVGGFAAASGLAGALPAALSPLERRLNLEGRADHFCRQKPGDRFHTLFSSKWAQ